MPTTFSQTRVDPSVTMRHGVYGMFSRTTEISNALRCMLVCVVILVISLWRFLMDDDIIEKEAGSISFSIIA